MKKKKYTQEQRILKLEKAVANLSVLIQALIDKVVKDERTAD